MLQRKAIRVRLYPNPVQLEQLDRMVGCCRALYNIALDQRRWFARPGRSISYARQAGELPALKETFDWFSHAPHHCLQQTLVDLETAYKNFWAGRAGAPKPRKRGIDDAMRFSDAKQFSVLGDVTTADKDRKRVHNACQLKLPKLGLVPCVLHRPIAGKVCSITISREGRQWMASIAIEQEVQTPIDRSSEPIVGIDMGVTQPVVLSTGQRFELPKATAADRDHQARLQRRVSSKTKGSNNRRKAIARLAAFKTHQTRVRRDAQEKVTTLIAKNHGVIAMEDLRIKSMTASARGTVEDPGKCVAQKAGLNRSLLDVSPGGFRLRLGQKLAAAGGMLILVPAPHTSQRCRVCGHIEAGNRASRDLFKCLACGHAEDADLNASGNIRDRARGVWGNAEKVEIAASLDMLLKQQAKPKRSLKSKANSDGPQDVRHRPVQAGVRSSAVQESGGCKASKLQALQREARSL